MATKPLVQQFSDDLLAVFEKYEDSGLTIAETIGALELLKYDVIRVAEQDNDGDA